MRAKPTAVRSLGVDEAQHRRRERRQQELRQRNPHQHAADFHRPVTLDRRQVLRDDVRRGQNGEAEERDEQEKQREVAARGEAQIDPGPVIGQLLHDEGDEQQPPADQQPEINPEFSQSSRLPWSSAA